MNLLGVFIAFVEWYDTSITVAFSNIIYHNFFPNFNKKIAFKIELLLLTISCIGKPIGSYLIGEYSDNNNRLKACKFSFFLMIFCSFIISFLPNFETIGHFSLFLIFLIKFIQGIAIGGNYATSVYAIEQSKEKFFISSLTSFSIFCGFLIANIFYTICLNNFSNFFNNVFAWRIGYFFTIIFSIPIIWQLNNEDLIKTKNEIIKDKKNNNSETYNGEIFEFFRACFLVLLEIVPFQYFHIFLPNYKRLILQCNEYIVQKGVYTTLLTINLITPIVGKMADKIGPMYFLKTSCLMMSFSFFLFGYLFESFSKFFIADIYFGIMMALCYGTLYCYLPMNFKKNSRAKLSGLALNLTTSIILLLVPAFSNQIEKNILNILLFIGTFGFILLSIEKKNKVGDKKNEF